MKRESIQKLEHAASRQDWTEWLIASERAWVNIRAMNHRKESMESIQDEICAWHDVCLNTKPWTWNDVPPSEQFKRGKAIKDMIKYLGAPIIVRMEQESPPWSRSSLGIWSWSLWSRLADGAWDHGDDQWAGALLNENDEEEDRGWVFSRLCQESLEALMRLDGVERAHEKYRFDGLLEAPEEFNAMLKKISSHVHPQSPSILPIDWTHVSQALSAHATPKVRLVFLKWCLKEHLLEPARMQHRVFDDQPIDVLYNWMMALVSDQRKSETRYPMLDEVYGWLFRTPKCSARMIERFRVTMFEEKDLEGFWILRKPLLRPEEPKEIMSLDTLDDVRTWLRKVVSLPSGYETSSFWLDLNARFEQERLKVLQQEHPRAIHPKPSTPRL